MLVLAVPHRLYLPVSSLLSHKLSGTEKGLLASEGPTADYTTWYLLKTKGCELCRTRSTSSLRAYFLLHNTAFIYEAIKKGEKKKREIYTKGRDHKFKIKYHKPLFFLNFPCSTQHHNEFHESTAVYLEHLDIVLRDMV